MGVMYLVGRTFKVDCTDKEAAVKLLEEAAEAYGAYEHVADLQFLRRTIGAYSETLEDMAKTDLADELADVVQAACNLAARYDIDMTAAMARCTLRMLERGNYDKA